MRRSLVLMLLAAAVFGVACSGGGGGGSGTPTIPSGTPTPSGTQPPGGSFDPLVLNNTWSYDVTYSTGPSKTKTVTVTAANEDVGGAKAGTLAFELDTTYSDNATQKEWHTDQGAVELRQRAEQFDTTGALKSDAYYFPSKLYVDETAAHTAASASWTEVYNDQTTDAATGQTTTTQHTITWTVLSSNESLTVGAGTFPCLKVHRKSNQVTTGGSDKTFWFSQGVGKVKEIDNDPANPSGTPTQTESLTSFMLH